MEFRAAGCCLPSLSGFHPIRRTRLDKVNDVSEAERAKW
jgi:hypothetical protein